MSEWDDPAADAVALTVAIMHDDLTGAGTVLRNADHKQVCVSLAKLLAELTSEVYCEECFRRWAFQAKDRP